MKRSRFSEEQIFDVLTEAERGAMTRDLARWLCVSEAMLNSWKTRMDVLTRYPGRHQACWRTLIVDLSDFHQALCWIMQALDPLSHIRNNRAEALFVTT